MDMRFKKSLVLAKKGLFFAPKALPKHALNGRRITRTQGYLTGFSLSELDIK